MSPADEILHAKLALEREIAQQIIFAGRRYILDWENAEGQLSPIAKHDHYGRIVAVLQRHYARVAMVMTGRRPPLNPTIEEAALSLKHLDSLQRRARHQASLIIASIDRELDKAGTVLSSQKAAPESDFETKEDVPQPTAGYVMSVIEAASSAIKKLKTFIGSIANAQTNGPAEEARKEQVEYTLEDYPANANAKLVMIWHNVGDNRVRGAPHNPRKSKFDHWTAEGQEVAADEPFTISGELLRFPGDSGLGASLGNCINCFVGETQVSGDVTGATRHLYSGDLVAIKTASGHELTGTPNHPILTPEGWVALGSLKKGGNVIRCGIGTEIKGSTPTTAVDALHVDHVEPCIEQIFDALDRGGVGVRVECSAVNFHGDRPTEDVDVVWSERVLRYGRDATTLKQIAELCFTSADLDKRFLLVDRLSGLLGGAALASASGGIGGSGKSASFGNIRVPHAEIHSLARPTNIHAIRNEPSPDRPTVCVEPFRQGQFGISGQVAADQIVSVDVRSAVCHVFNLESVQKIFTANGFVVHNCRCYLETVAIREDGSRVTLHKGPSAPARPRRRTGDRVGANSRIPATPTSRVTLNGNTRARVILKDGSPATLRQPSPTSIEIRIGSKVVGRADIGTGGQLRNVKVAEGHRHQGIEELMRRSAVPRTR